MYEVPSMREQQVLERKTVREILGDKEYFRRIKHVKHCAIELGLLTHVHTDYGTRYEDNHPWPCEQD